MPLERQFVYVFKFSFYTNVCMLKLSYEVAYRGACWHLKTLISKEKEEKELLEEKLQKRRVGTEREDRHEGIYHILDQSVHKWLREMHSK
jgi:hypothetical protein